MKRVYYLIFALVIFSPFCVDAFFKPGVINSKDDLVYFIRYYNGFQTKIDNNIISLVDDVIIDDFPIKINLKEDLIIDLNGHDIIGKNNPCFIIDGDSKLLTITNSSKSPSFVKSDFNSIIINNGRLKISNINILSTSYKYDSLIINGGKTRIIDSIINSSRDAISLNNGFIRISSGTFTGRRYGFVIENGKALVDGGVFKGYSSGLKLNNYQSFYLKDAEFITISSDLLSDNKPYNDLFVPFHFYKFLL